MRLLKLCSIPALLLLSASVAHAQEMGLSAEASTEEGVEAEADVEAEAEVEPEPEPEPKPIAEPMASPPPAEPEAAPDTGSPLSLSMFVDAYYALQTQKIGTPVPFHRAYVGSLGAGENGFSLSFAGIDATYDVGEAAATVSFRAGPSVPIFYGGDQGPLGLDNIVQAYGTWRPSDSVELDLGQFGTIFGAEVAESWQNLNYTRGGLYYAMQPFWHTGLRASVALNDEHGLTFMAVNGVNNISEAESADPKAAPSLAAQYSYGTDTFSIAAGGLASFETENDGFDLFGDIVVTANPTDALSLVFNADYNVDSDAVDTDGDGEPDDSTSFFGVSGAAGYALSDTFGIAGRLEYLVDSDNALYGALDDTGAPEEDVNVITVTGTLDYKPLATDTLVIRWDNRFETSSGDIYADLDGNPDSSWMMSTLGLVVQGGN